MTTLLETEYTNRFNMLRVDLQEADFFSLSTDCWSSKNNKHEFLSLIAHYADSGCRRQFAVLATTPMPDGHTGDEVARAIQSALDEANLSTQHLHLVVRDAASSMRRATRLLGVESFDCFLHKIQLAVEDGWKLRPMDDTIQLAKKLAGFFNSSARFQQLLFEAQDQLQLPPSFKREVLKGLNSRMAEQARRKHLLLATLLDPRCKLQVIATDDQVYAKHLLVQEVLEEKGTRPHDTTPATLSTAVDTSDPIAAYVTRPGLSTHS